MELQNKTIAKNTLFLYFRMLLVMVVSLYTSRVILHVLGVADFGIYQVVGGVVSMLGFVNGALSTGTSRFLTFELGRGDSERLKRTFCTVLNGHIIIALLVVLLAETVGLWFVNHKLAIPIDRMEPAVFAYHLSILTVFFTLTQVPYTASIISHEKMNVYAYVSIVEVILKLSVVYVLKLNNNFDNLKLYAVLLCLIQISIALFYRVYCVKHFFETHYHLIWDKKILNPVIRFSGWSLFAQVSIALNSQGFIIITNMFFGPAVVTARAIALQVNMAAMQFINNFRTAVNPQIVKKLAANDESGSRQLLLQSTKYSYYLMLILALPIILGAKKILALWLGNVPDYATIFLELIVVQSLFSVFDTSFYTALYAKGRLKENALTSPMIGFVVFPVVYILFKLGFSPLVLSYAGIIQYALLGCVIKPILVHKIAGYAYRDIVDVFIPCIRVTLLALVFPLIFKGLLPDTYLAFFLNTAISIGSVSVVVYFYGIDAEMRLRINAMILRKMRSFHQI